MRKLSLGSVLLALVLLTGCMGDADAVWEQIEKGALVVDVRSAAEFNEGHVPGAILIPVDEVEKRIAEFGEDKSRPIVLYCKRGVRAGRAEGVLEAHGYTNVINGGGYADIMALKP